MLPREALVLSDLALVSLGLGVLPGDDQRLAAGRGAVNHLLDPLELSFSFGRPTRFLDMEGGTSILAEPNAIADRYHKALQTYLKDLRQVMLECSVDYHLVDMAQSYEQVLMRFLVGRTRGKGGAGR